MLKEGAEAEREWMVEVERMTESFRMTKWLFLTSLVSSLFCELD